eukprot:CAMPEP_0175061918 /NCGR_PEP_ID=MMETSP0052_2-20121109/13860_1 /TAXON_ID=51329 ORGANISM="Polytomella parva, Strain SAG 63-3" /NCGR_SAMPLE_ID=MMETSP0052_2 /ASSEMBLY_ACC=CAM_ASM_000194 /LENGTH=61 /DNA_ID=CAMNT_0016327843 /DNA_START=32 /DNA_END=214 /DNA_ORIENTATION=+
MVVIVNGRPKKLSELIALARRGVSVDTDLLVPEEERGEGGEETQVNGRGKAKGVGKTEGGN